ncbi:MAG: GNAT family N-acetyltransferase [Bacteroidota bacterium]|nr:GNAT family N-acetyltransferase [Bacteroidota bacterium]
MKLIEVKDKKSRKEFLEVPKILYSKSEAWICPLDKEIEGIFNPHNNRSFEKGEAVRWILKSNNGNPIGRIAAFFNLTEAYSNRQPTGGIGFFEIIEDQDAAFYLFNTAIDWLKSKGMEAVDAPINFGENYNYWGLLVEGFTHPGYGMPYHKPYYQQFFEEYGFKNYYEQYSYHKDVGAVTVFPERFARIADRVEQKPGYIYEHLRFEDADKYVNDLVEVYNSAWSEFKSDFTPIDPENVKKAFLEAKFLIDEELIWFVYYDNKPIAFFVILPDINQIFRHLNGKLGFWNIVKVSWYKKRKAMTRVRALIAGVHPKFQNIGVETVYFKRLFEVFRKKTFYKELELSWVGDFNPKMISIYKALGATQAKKHITYRYLFNKDSAFIRYKDEASEPKV